MTDFGGAFMKRWYLFSGILAALLGLLVIIFPAFWIKLVVVILGLAAIAYGIYSLKITKVISDELNYRRTIFIKSIVSIVAGLMAVLFPLAIGGAAWTAMIWLLIFYLLISAAAGFYAAALLKDSGVERKRYIIENLLLLFLALLNHSIKEKVFHHHLLFVHDYSLLYSLFDSSLGSIIIVI